MQEFTVSHMTDYLHAIGCRCNYRGQFNTAWELFACAVAFNNGWDIDELFKNRFPVYSRDTYSHPHTTTNVELCQIISNEPMDTDIEKDLETFAAMFGTVQ